MTAAIGLIPHESEDRNPGIGFDTGDGVPLHFDHEVGSHVGFRGAVFRIAHRLNLGQRVVCRQDPQPGARAAPWAAFPRSW
jgi:hypothetical protein